MKHINILFACLLLGAVGATLFLTQPEPEVNEVATIIKDPVQVRIVATGEIAPYQTVSFRAQTPSGYFYEPFFSEIRPFLENNHLTICPQDAPIASGETGVAGYPLFNAPTSFARDIAKAGCNSIALANDHIGDKGIEGALTTKTEWEQQNPILLSGVLDTASPLPSIDYTTIEGVTFAFASVTDVLPLGDAVDAVATTEDAAALAATISEARDNADYVIVSIHWGIEEVAELQPRQTELANIIAEAGADLIIGTGPQALQTVETITNGERSTTVYYSLGNLLTTQLNLEQLIGGLAVVNVTIQDSAIIDHNYSFLPTYMHYTWSENDISRTNYLGRDNLKIHPLDQATEVFAESEWPTTIEQQQESVRNLIQASNAATVIDSQDF